jgi:diguanylate cyclase (GGDEF)-like protein/PAS domain S-box-containing protein
MLGPTQLPQVDMAEHRVPSIESAPGAVAGDAVRAERDRLRALVDGVEALLATTLTGDEALARLLDAAITLTGANGAALGIVDGECIETVAAVGPIDTQPGRRTPRTAGLAGCAVNERALREHRADARLHLAMPVCHLGETIGVLEAVAHDDAARHRAGEAAAPQASSFDAQSLDTMRLVAGLAGLALGRERVLALSERLEVERRSAWEQAMTLLAASPTATIVHDLEGRVQLWNSAAEALLGWSQDEVIGQPVPIGEGNAMRFADLTARIVHGAGHASVVVRRPRKDGSDVHVRVSGAPLHDERGEVVAIVRTLEDISALSAHAESLKAAADRLHHIIEHSHDAFVSMDESGRVIEWNRAAETMFGWTRSEALLRPVHELIIPAELHGAHRAGLQRFLGSGQSEIIGRRIEVVGRRRDGSPVPIELSISATTLDGRPVFDAFLQDISERTAQLDALRERARRDALTGLPGREHFQSRLQALLDRHRDSPQHLAVIVLDLDGFRAINELYGHATGDALLQVFAERLAAAVREQDIVARLGGDEFAIVLDRLREAREDAPIVAAKLLAAFDAPAEVRQTALPLEVSLGVALHEYPQDDVDALMHRAYEALREAKRAGGRRWALFAGAAPHTG